MAQNTNSMIKLALVFFVSLLSFSIGTYVGKKYSDNQHKLAALEPNKKEEVAKHEPNEFASSAEDKAHAESTTSGTLTDNEVAKLAEEFAAEEAQETEPGTAIQIAEVTEKEIQVVDSKEKVAPKTATVKAIPVVKEQMPVATTRPTQSLPAKVAPTSMTQTQAAAKQIEKLQLQQERIPAAISPADSSGAQFTLQVGSFPTPAEAQKLAVDLQSKGYKSSFVPALVNGQTWYRVNIGLFGTSKEAIQYKKEFLEKTKLTSAIVQKVQTN